MLGMLSFNFSRRLFLPLYNQFLKTQDVSQSFASIFKSAFTNKFQIENLKRDNTTFCTLRVICFFFHQADQLIGPEHNGISKETCWLQSNSCSYYLLVFIYSLFTLILSSVRRLFDPPWRRGTSSFPGHKNSRGRSMGPLISRQSPG